MSSNTTPYGKDPNKAADAVLATLVNRAYNQAKWWAGLVIIFQTALYASGVLAIFWPLLTLNYPWVALPLAGTSTYIAGYASKLKGMAESAKRHHEYLSGFGLQPSGAQLADLRQSLKKQLSADVDALLKEGITYASKEEPGSRRVLENLVESAWYTKHLASTCTYILGFVFISSCLLALSLLVLAATSLSGTGVGVTSAKCIAATLLFLISVGMTRSWLSYYKLSQTSASIDATALRLWEKSEEPSAFEAQRLLAEYQLARAGAPLIPTWVWKFRRNSLNEDWELKQPRK